MKDSWSVRTYCTRDSSCVGSYVGIGNWNASTYHMSMYTNANTRKSSGVDWLNTECGRDSASQLMHGEPHLPAFLWLKVRTMHDKPDCVRLAYSKNLFSYMPWPVCCSQSSCLLEGQIAPLCGSTPWQALLCKHDNFYGLFAVIWYFTGKDLATKQFKTEVHCLLTLALQCSTFP